MKTKIFKTVFILLTITIILISYFSIPSANILGSSYQVTYLIPDSQYHIGAFDNGWYSHYNYLIDSLKFNVWHNYSEIDRGWYNDSNDNYRNPIPPFVDTIVRDNSTKNMRTYMDRPILQYLVSGQRADYQCEDVQYPAPYWYYAYKTSASTANVYDTNDYSQYGTGERVKYCRTDPNNMLGFPMLIDSGLISNREMSFNGTNKWMNDNYWDWYVMPRIRIDSAYAAGSIHDTENVCRIVVTGWDSSIVKDIVLKVKNFKYNAPDSIYRGNYMEKFFMRTNQDSLFISKNLWERFINKKDRDFFAFDWTKPCGVDIKVYWYGKCDMWIDRVRIENEPAHQYLTLRNSEWINRLNAEIDLAGRNQISGRPNYFYFEECEFSHFPAIKEINQQIMQRTTNANTLVIWLNYDMFRLHIPGFPFGDSSFFNAPQLKALLQDTFKLNTIVMGSYALEGHTDEDISNNPVFSKSYHPNTIYGGSNLGYDRYAGRLSYNSTPSFYDSTLQTHLDLGRGGTHYTYMHKLMCDLSKNSDLRIINCPQAHLWFSSGHKLKEPSNEEIEL